MLSHPCVAPILYVWALDGGGVFVYIRQAMSPRVIKIKRRSVSAPSPAKAKRRPLTTRTASSATTTRRPGTAGYGNQRPAKHKPQGGPPVALFVVIGFVVVLLIGLGVASSSSRCSTPHRVQNQTYQRQGSRQSDHPMRDYMESHEEPELLKARKARMAGKQPRR